MIDMLKDFMTIFKNSKNEFYKDKYKADELLKRVKYLKSLILANFEKNKEILDYLYANMYYYPKYMRGCIDDLVALFKYSSDSKALTPFSNFIYLLEDIKTTCYIAYNSMDKNFKKRDFVSVIEEYGNLIKKLRDYEKRYNMVILDDFYDYDKI